MPDLIRQRRLHKNEGSLPGAPVAEAIATVKLRGEWTASLAATAGGRFVWLYERTAAAIIIECDNLDTCLAMRSAKRFSRMELLTFSSNGPKGFVKEIVFGLLLRHKYKSKNPFPLVSGQSQPGSFRVWIFSASDFGA
jgi:hypothetical protein